MNEPADRRVLTAPAKPPRYPVRNSTACVEISIAITDSGILGNGPAVQVRCGACGSRLFDVAVGPRLLPKFGIVLDGSLRLARKCPSCDLVNEGSVTDQDGKRLTARNALAGPWRCECGRSLGYVNDIRGRVHVTCRCKHETRVVAANAIAVAYSDAA